MPPPALRILLLGALLLAPVPSGPAPAGGEALPPPPPPAAPPAPAPAPAPAPREPAPPAAAPAQLPAPQWVGAVDARGKAQLTWILNPAFSLVKVFRRPADVGPAAQFVLVAEATGNSWLDAEVVPGRAYRYRLVGVHRDGRESKPSAELAVRIAAVAFKPPTPPLWEGHLVTADGVGLKWSAREDEDVIAYNVYRRGPEDERPRLVGSARGTAFHDTGVAAGQTYAYTLTALDSAFRETEPSAELLVAYAPAAPEPEKRPAAAWRVRRTRLIALVSGGDVPFLRPADVVVGPLTRSVYVADSGRNRVFVFSERGAFQRNLGVGQRGESLFRRVLGLAADRSETIYAVDAGAGVVQAFVGGASVGRRVEVPGTEGVRATGLIDAAVGPDGRLFVVDNLNNRVVVLGEGAETRSFGRPGYQGGELSAPTFCALDADGNLVVAEALNGRVQAFSPGGEFVRAFGRYSRGPGGFGRPKGVAVSPAGEIYVADSWLNAVQVFDAAGGFVAVLGDEAGRPLDLGSPNGVALGHGNLVYVAERLAGRLQIREVLDAP